MNESKPLEYILGFSDFLGCKIDLSQKPMIPRPETEFWLKKAIQDINLSRAKSREDISVLDIFAGSGCIGVAVLKNCPEFCKKVVFGEIDKNLIKQIKLNLKINKIPAKKYKVIQSDIFEKIKGKLAPQKTRFDYIFANPPYVAEKRKHLVQKSVLDFEFHKALFGGEDGMFFINKFLKDAKKHLNKNGKIYLEFDSFQKKMIEKLLKQYKYKKFEFYKDQFKKWRWAEIC